MRVEYLQEALQAMEWIMSLSSMNIEDTIELRSFLYSDTETYPYNYTGYGSGVAGIGDHLLDLYLVTGNNSWLNYAEQSGYWLLSTEIDGTWLYGGVDYLTDTYNEDGNFLGLSAGSTGIGLFLLNLYTLTNNTKFLDPVNRIYKKLGETVIETDNQLSWGMQTKGIYSNRITTGLNHGITGIGTFLNKYYRMFNNEEILDYTKGIHNYLVNKTNNEGLIPTEIDSFRSYYDSSFFEGLAGIGLFYIDNILTIQEEYSKRNEIFKSATFFKSFENQKVVTNTDKENIPSQTATSNGYTIIALLSVFLILQRKRKKE
ncbi:MAG: lanthionine synthetase LanC family protein [Candidatus Hodarchaeales archaeon]